MCNNNLPALIHKTIHTAQSERWSLSACWSLLWSGWVQQNRFSDFHTFLILVVREREDSAFPDLLLKGFTHCISPLTSPPSACSLPIPCGYILQKLQNTQHTHICVQTPCQTSAFILTFFNFSSLSAGELEVCLKRDAKCEKWDWEKRLHMGGTKVDGSGERDWLWILMG